jgi:hypothetical protein
MLAQRNMVARPAREVDVLCEVDVVVAGGGAAGVAAAVCAARAGASVVLLERNGFLGGTMTSTSLGGICGLYSLIDGEPVQMVYGFAEEVRGRLDRAGGIRGALPWLQTASLPYDLFIMKSVLDDLAETQHLDVLYQARLVEAGVDGRRIRHAVVRGRGGLFAIRGNTFIDCTGDGELAAMAGAATEYDRTALQFPTAMFRMGGVDTTVAMKVPRDEMHRLLEQAVSDGYDLPRTAGGIYSVRDGIVHLNITKVKVGGRTPDTFDPFEFSQAEREGRRQARLYLDVFRRYIPGYTDAYILDTGAELGIRETRRIVGRHILTSDDVLTEQKFEDAIAVNCWPIEDHGGGRTTRWVWLSPGGYNHIPYRALLPCGVDNLLVAGRCLSSTHDAQAAIRVTANCFSTGQAAGLAAVMAGSSDMASVDIKSLQSALKASGVDLITVPEAANV